MHKRIFLGLAIAWLWVSATTASAADFDYDWLSGGALNLYPGAGLIEHGWFVDGSAAVAPQFSLEGTFYRTDQGNYCPQVALGRGVVRTFGCVGQASNRESYRVGGGCRGPLFNRTL